MLKRNDTVFSVVQTKDDTEVVFQKTLLDVLRKNTNYKYGNSTQQQKKQECHPN